MWLWQPRRQLKAAIPHRRGGDTEIVIFCYRNVFQISSLRKTERSSLGKRVGFLSRTPLYNEYIMSHILG